MGEKILDLLAKDLLEKVPKIFSQMEDFMSLLVISHGSKKYHLEQIQQIDSDISWGNFLIFVWWPFRKDFPQQRTPPILLIGDRKNDQTPDVMQLFPIDLFGLIDPLSFKIVKIP